MEMLAPVVLFVYNRERHTQKSLDALKSNKLAEKSQLFIFSDGPRTEQDKDKVQKVREVIEQYKSDFLEVQVIKAEKNKGLAASVISGVSEVIKKYGKVIVLEDDIITTPYFLSYMNQALYYYEKNRRIWSVSGYTLEMKSLKKYSDSVYFGYRASSWGWGTWLDRWEKVDWQVKDFEKAMKDESVRKKLNRGGEDMCQMLESQMRGEIDSWAIRWCYQQSKEDMLTVFPKISYVKNIGCDGTGTHSGKTTQFDTKWSEESKNMEIHFTAPYINGKVTKEFHDIYTGTLRIRIRNKLKNILRLS